MSKKTIGFQGSIGANSNLACQKFYPDFAAQAFATFFDVFKAVESGEVEYGMIPLENSYAGRVSEIHNLLQEGKVSIIAEHSLLIQHNLAGLDLAKLEDITEVLSHPQALMQCQNSLRQLNFKLREFSNTAEAAKFVANGSDKSKAALCSKMAAQTYGLKIIKENMQDLQGNTTTFIVIAKEAIDADPKIAPVVTTMLFTIRNIPGSLYKVLGGFATNNVNMVKLESYIPGGASKQAKFFITIDGHPNQRNVAQALEEMGFFSQNVKLLGVYYADKSRFES
ncbi:MAG: prephenate dehydratase [Proteobacteria bacterium]|nr:prephenate dehydratase [Pseudomonadota bacterium]